MTERRRIESEVDEEIRFHIEMRVRELERAGWPFAQARAEALRRFGSVVETRAVCSASDLRKERRMRMRGMVAGTVQDVMTALRALRQQPGHTAAMVLALALGVGSATAIFSVADGVLLRPLPYADVARVMTIWETDARTGGGLRTVAPANFLDWQERQRTFEAIGLAEPFGFDLTGDGPPESLRAWAVSSGFFDALGVRPVTGRAFAAAEYASGAARVVLLSYGFWQTRLGGDPGIVGTTLDLDGAATTVIGVMPALDHPEPRDLWAPKWFRDYERFDREDGHDIVVGRLRAGSTAQAAQSELAGIARTIAAENPAANSGVSMVPLETHLLGSVRPALLVLLAATGLLLLIACVDVAGLLLVRYGDRRRDLAVRAAIGAPRGRLLGQLLAESLLLALLGGAAGILIAALGVRAMLQVAPDGLPRMDAIALDGRPLVFSLAVTLLTALLFGVGPALRFARTEASAALAGGRTMTGSRRTLRVRSLLVIAQIALALVLLVGAGLLARSFARLLDNDPGFAVTDRATLQLFIADRAPTPAARMSRIRAWHDHLLDHPGVTAVAEVSALPFHPTQIDVVGPVAIEGRTADPDARASAQSSIASPGYFALMDIALRQGRDFTQADDADAARVAILSASLARRLFPAEDPIGRSVVVGVMGRPQAREIVGVVEDIRAIALDSEPRLELYIPYAQSSATSVTFVARTQGSAAALMPSLRERIWDVDPGQTIHHAATVESLIGSTLALRRFNLLLLAAFSLAAAALAAIGVHGLITFAARARTPEFGVRLALGATRATITLIVLRQATVLALTGILVGIAAAAALSRFMNAMLYETTPTDPGTYIVLALLMLVAALAAAAVPAVQAACTHPARALTR